MGGSHIRPSGQRQVSDTRRIELHDAAAGRVHGDGVRPGDDDSGRARGTLDRTVALHSYDPVDNRKGAREQCVQVLNFTVTRHPDRPAALIAAEPVFVMPLGTGRG